MTLFSKTYRTIEAGSVAFDESSDQMEQIKIRAGGTLVLTSLKEARQTLVDLLAVLGEVDRPKKEGL